VKKIIQIYKNSYYDSVTLMSISADIKSLEGIDNAVISMATDMNKDLLKKVDLYIDDVDGCNSNDLVIAYRYDEGSSLDEKKIDEIIEKALKGDSGSDAGENREEVFKTLKNAKVANPDCNMAIISVPGEHAAREAMQALKSGINVMLFSDNVTMEEERNLKEYAVENDLLVMGPDCGTAYINRVGLCFANKVTDGCVGIAGASGTGMQEIMVLVDKFGGGISNAIGVGGRDLKKEIGGLMMMSALRMLEADTKTKVIIMVSKVPSDEVYEKLTKLINEEITKPVVVYFTTDRVFNNNKNIFYTGSLKEAASLGVGMAYGINSKCEMQDVLNNALNKCSDSNDKYIRGLYCGGTLCGEAYYFLRNHLTNVYSNIASHEEEKITYAFENKGNMLIDLGDDLFTRGRPHPMIDPTIRLERIIDCAKDSETGVILMDFELGYGAHEDPVGATIDTIKSAMKIAENENRKLSFVAYVQGTDKDYQGLKKSEKMLEEAGCYVCHSNIDAVIKAYELLQG